MVNLEDIYSMAENMGMICYRTFRRMRLQRYLLSKTVMVARRIRPSLVSGKELYSQLWHASLQHVVLVSYCVVLHL